MAVLLFATACSHTEKFDVPKLLWHAQPKKGLPIQSIYPVFWKNRAIVCQPISENRAALVALSLDDGRTLWEIDDTTGSLSALYYNLKPQLFENLLLLPIGPETWAFDVERGQVVWKNRIGQSGENFIEGDNGQAFRSFFDEKKHSHQIAQIDVRTGESRIVFEELVPAGSKSALRTPVLLSSKNSSKILLLASTEQDFLTKRTVGLVRFFNLETGRIDQTDTLSVNFEGLGPTKQPLVDAKGNRLFILCFNEIFCFSISEKRLVWKKKLLRELLSSELALDGDRLFAACEDGFLRCLNAKNGELVWQASATGTPSRLCFLPKIVHFVGGGDGLWYFIRASDGAKLKVVQGPNVGLLPAAHFRRAFAMEAQRTGTLLNDGKNWLFYEMP